ncbi:MAG: hypothetical protein Q7R93_01580 [bacterium]|nr:hypothetical protein [bacterium]
MSQGNLPILGSLRLGSVPYRMVGHGWAGGLAEPTGFSVCTGTSKLGSVRSRKVRSGLSGESRRAFLGMVGLGQAWLVALR